MKRCRLKLTERNSGLKASLAKLTLIGGLYWLAGLNVSVADEHDYDKYKEVFSAIPAIPPIPSDNSLTPARVELGRKLYWDRRTSKTGATSCGFCHHPAYYGAEPMDRSVGVFGEIHAANAHTVLNAAFHSSQFFSGSAETLEAQALGAVKSHVASRSWPEEVAERLNRIPGYSEESIAAYGEPLTEEIIGKAIASFMRTLVTPDYALARWLAGDETAMNDQQKMGMKAFADKGCVACHSGALFSNFTFQKFEIEGGEHHPGRYSVTENEEDRFRYKVPSLLNVAMTPPYTHAGVIKTLPDMVEVMGEKMLNIELTEQEIADITAFLGTLTGTMPDSFTHIPVLPIGGGEGDYGPELMPSTKE
ncbi:MAG: c-type cytochrome [Granulosicoccus sp.]|nr:c-type cytochrome [Granulosicoccus sp.]